MEGTPCSLLLEQEVSSKLVMCCMIEIVEADLAILAALPLKS